MFAMSPYPHSPHGMLGSTDFVMVTESDARGRSHVARLLVTRHADTMCAPSMRASSALAAFAAVCWLAAGCGGDRADGGGATTTTGGSGAGGAASGAGGAGGVNVGGAGGGAGGVAVVPEHAELYVQWAMKTIQTGPGTVGYGFENLATHSEATESSGRLDNMWGWGCLLYTSDATDDWLVV